MFAEHVGAEEVMRYIEASAGYPARHVKRGPRVSNAESSGGVRHRPARGGGDSGPGGD